MVYSAGLDFNRPDGATRFARLAGAEEVGEIGRYFRSDLVKWRALVQSATITAG
jgi:hypothetical protein